MATPHGPRFHVKRPGRLLTVAGRQLHVLVEGNDGSGAPAVVLVGGLAGNWFDWDALTADLEADRAVVRFDRPGFGFSPADGEAPTAPGEADRIAAVLDAAGVEGPVVVVGHSLGGFYAEAFARRHPRRVAGLILLDASVSGGHRGKIPRRWRTTGARRTARVVTRSGLQRLLGPTVAWVFNRAGLEEHTRDWVRAIYQDPRYLEAALVEDAVFPDLAADVAALRRSDPLPRVPVAVVAAHTGRPTPWGRVWLRWQRALAATLGARLVVLRPAHHHAMIDQPDRLARLIRELTEPVAGDRPTDSSGP
ncbi:alpha/beta fold hydrolase [Rhodococcus sp. NPDC003318]|uniref:alpha/beta fold hydrolase n=1 Tax=Rhodococcus sp. NPDC003318 TaxID=3364503 RepID=UPI00367A9CFA